MFLDVLGCIQIFLDVFGCFYLVAPWAGSLVFFWDVPGRIHPTVGLQHVLFDPTSSLTKWFWFNPVTDRIPKQYASLFLSAFLYNEHLCEVGCAGWMIQYDVPFALCFDKSSAPLSLAKHTPDQSMCFLFIFHVRIHNNAVQCLTLSFSFIVIADSR